MQKKKHKQETKTTSENSEEMAKLNKRAKQFLAHHRINRQPQNSWPTKMYEDKAQKSCEKVLPQPNPPQKRVNIVEK